MSESKADILKQKRILIVDDVSTYRVALSSFLEKLGFENIDVAEDGNIAWDKLMEAQGTEPYGLVFSDINMPNCNGIELVKRLKSSEILKSTPIVMVSTENESSMVLDAISLGAANYIIKPFSAEVLIQKLKEVGKQIL
jgi:two-component system, chemotaxis family, chemotaxis protein CheY